MSDPTRILFVDDDYESLRDLKSFLEEDGGFRVEIDASMQMLGRLKSERFDLIFVDIMIHALGFNEFGEETYNIRFTGTAFTRTGVEFYRRLRAGEFNDSSDIGTPSDVPVIFLSASPAAIFETAEMPDRRTSYLEKPYRFRDLRACMSDLMSQASQAA